MADTQHNGGGRAVKEMNPAGVPAATDAKAPDSETGNTGQACLAMGQREAVKVDETFFATGKGPAQTQKTLPMLAKSVEPGLNGPVIRPHWLVAFKCNIVLDSIRGRIAAKKQSQFS